MISYAGYEELIGRVYDHGQEHVFEYWDSLSDAERGSLLNDLGSIDFGRLKALFGSAEAAIAPDFTPAPYIALPATDTEREEAAAAREKGIAVIRRGAVAAFMVAGGQGSRLGFDGPKGKFPVAPVSGKTLFQIHAEKIVKYGRKYGVAIPWLIMTSNENHDETMAFFEANGFFGLKRDDVIVFPQNMIPSLDTAGKLMLQTKCRIFKNPDGHGGSLTALQTSGALAEMKRRGVEIISYFQVDNPLVKIIDPLFVGYHVRNSADISSKMLKKAYAEEKVGVFVRFSDNSMGVVEYSDLPSEKIHDIDDVGNLRYIAGSIAIHLFNRSFIEGITSGTGASLPFHVARKKIKALKAGAIQDVEGFKFEKFVFDALPLTGRNVIMESLREEEFAPVKNPTGIDSVESSQQLMDALHRRWLMERGVAVPGRTRVVEISPLRAVEAEDLVGIVALPDEERVYLA